MNKLFRVNHSLFNAGCEHLIQWRWIILIQSALRSNWILNKLIPLPRTPTGIKVLRRRIISKRTTTPLQFELSKLTTWSEASFSLSLSPFPSCVCIRRVKGGLRRIRPPTVKSKRVATFPLLLLAGDKLHDFFSDRSLPAKFPPHWVFILHFVIPIINALILKFTVRRPISRRLILWFICFEVISGCVCCGRAYRFADTLFSPYVRASFARNFMHAVAWIIGKNDAMGGILFWCLCSYSVSYSWVLNQCGRRNPPTTLRTLFRFNIFLFCFRFPGRRNRFIAACKNSPRKFITGVWVIAEEI